MKTIQLTQEQIALVDDEDYDYLNQWKWYAVKNGKTYYAGRQTRLRKNKQRQIWMHREVLGLPDDLKIEGEHIDHNGCNNQRNNLRIATRSQNNANKSKRKNASSKYLGVVWSKRSRKWQVKIRKDKIVRHLGYYIDEREAAKAYNNAAIKLHGEFANLNNVAI